MKTLAWIALAAAACAAQVPIAPPAQAGPPERLRELIRAGNLYLSLSDAIALALENNLDVEYQRYMPSIAGTDVLRTKGGGTPRGISLVVTEVPPGMGGPSAPISTAAATGALPSTAVPTNLSEFAAITPSTSGIAITGAVPFSLGPAIPVYDPALTGSLLWQHQNTPEVNSSIIGSTSLVTSGPSGNVGVTQGFSTGTQVGLNFNGLRQTTNSTRYTYNPYTSSALGLTVTQPLLRGFGVSMNRRFIRIAANNRRTSDLVFKQQAIATVAGVIRLYDDLVALTDDVSVREQTLVMAQRLYEDNRVAVQQGTLAPVELTRAQAQVAAAREDLANSRGYRRQQELILKNVLTRRFTADPLVRNAHIVATTPIEVPETEPVRPVDDLVGEALRNRPEMEEARLQIQNSHYSVEGTRNQLLPELDLVASAQNSGLAGQLNPGSVSTGTAALLPADQTLTGGFGTGLSQVFTGRFATYSIGLQLVLPIRNRIAQADLARDQMQLKQWNVRQEQLENQVRLEVEGALIAVEQARVAYDTAVEARKLQEQSLNIEMERFGVGLSTTFLVLQYQSFVAQARSTEVAARDVYVKAETSLERALGQTLENHGISLDDALRGRLARPPVGTGK